MKNWSLHEKSSCGAFGPLQGAKKGAIVFFHIFYFFSRTTGWISTKLGTKHSHGEPLQICEGKGYAPIGGPGGDKSGKNWVIIKKSSSHEPLVQMTSYLMWRVLRARSTMFANENEIESKMASPGGTENGWKFNCGGFILNLVKSIPIWWRTEWKIPVPPLGPFRGQKGTNCIFRSPDF